VKKIQGQKINLSDGHYAISPGLALRFEAPREITAQVQNVT
jgi:hypothetical protein